MYEVVLTKRAIKDLEKLDQNVKSRILNRLRDYSSNPFRYARKLIDPSIGEYRFRIGDYRVIFDIDNSRIVVLRIGHRKKIYLL